MKKFKDSLNAESKERLAKRQEKLDTLIWWYEDLRYVNVDHIIRERLESGEGNSLTLGYVKLMERWLKFRELNANDIYSLLIPRIEAVLSKFKASVASPVAVLGDASVFDECGLAYVDYNSEFVGDDKFGQIDLFPFG